MLSFFDALSFATRKKTLLLGFITAIIMLFFLISIGFSLQNHYSLYSLLKSWLTAEKGSVTAYAALGNIAIMLKDHLFWGIIFQKTLQASFLLLFCGLSFFTS